MTSGPPVIASAPKPVPCLLFQPSPCSSRAPLSGSGPTSDGSPAPCVLPKVWPPAISATAGEAECLEAHRFERDVAGENHQVGPGDFPAVLLLDRPQQPARLVEVRVVRPAVERGEALLPGAGAAAAVRDAVGTRTVP